LIAGSDRRGDAETVRLDGVFSSGRRGGGHCIPIYAFLSDVEWAGVKSVDCDEAAISAFDVVLIATADRAVDYDARSGRAQSSTRAR
jgi:hypothetical protein